MKTYKMLLLAMFVIVAMPSCLDENPKDQVDQSEIYGSANDIYVNAVASLYNYIGSNAEGEGLQGTCRGVFDYNTFTTDEVMNPIRGGDWYDGGFWEHLYGHTWTDDDTYLYNVWTYLFKVITLSNEAIIIIDTHKDLLTEAQIATFKAEVRAVRAMFYWYAMDMFGRIPLPTLVETAQKQNSLNQKSRETTYRFIIDELQAALPYLPDEHSNLEGNYYGRVTRPVAHFILAKLCLNAEIYADNDWTDEDRPEGRNIQIDVDGQTMNAWEACQHYCDLITATGYQLEESYAANFAVNNETSRENIFTIPMDKNLYKSEYHYLFRSLHYKHGGALSRAAENGTCATIATIKAYGYGTSTPDTRLALNLYTDTVYVDGAKVMLDNGEPLIYHPLDLEINLTFSPYIQTGGARLAKYEIDRTAYADGKLPNNDIVLFRYADVLLMKAEAKTRNGQDGTAELNAVRSRVGMPAVACTLENILKERLLELFFEGWRRQDLVRFDVFHRDYDLRTPIDGEADRHTIVFPIPSKTLDLNNRLTQNPGY